MIVSNILVLALAIYFLVKQFEKMNLPTKIVLCMILGGGISNLIDRIFRGYVIDFIKVEFIKFPVFNIADILVVLGWIIFVFLTIRYALDGKKTIRSEK